MRVEDIDRRLDARRQAIKAAHRRLLALHDNIFSPLFCDIEVLREHPAVAAHEAADEALQILSEQLSEIHCRIFDWVLELKRMGTELEAAQPPPPIGKLN